MLRSKSAFLGPRARSKKNQSVVPHVLHEPHRPVLVALDDHERDEDVAHALGDRVAAVQHPARVAADVPAINGQLPSESGEPSTTTINHVANSC